MWHQSGFAYCLVFTLVVRSVVTFESVVHSRIARAAECNPPCQNEARCQINEVTGSPFCECLNLFTGDDCSQHVFQNHNPCLNSGHCKPDISPCECECTQEWTGDRCEQQNYCHWDRCNGGVCTSEETIHRCSSCPEGRSGYNCEIKDGCNPNPCQNNGNCTQFGTDGFKCTCEEGFTGVTCADINPCGSNPCGHGTCNWDGYGAYTCTCDIGYLLPDCQIFSYCQTELNSCVHGDCSEEEYGYKCNCYSGWIGPHCATADPCNLNPCQNSGTCTYDGSQYTCACTAGYFGINCEITDVCNPVAGEPPCPNGASCTQTDSSYVCDCPSGTSGSTCEVFDDVCTFESAPESNCFFNQATDDNFDWIRQTGSSGTPGTGPSDASEGLYYMIADSSELLTPNNMQAKLTANLNIASGSTRCLKFRYNMYGLEVNKLSVTRNGVETWSMEGDRGQNWHTGAVDISGSTTAIKVEFVAILGKGGQSDIALDNIVLHPLPCEPCDDDTSQPCYLNNECVPQGNQGYTCSCQSGFEGPDCDIVDVPLSCDFEDITQCFLEQVENGNGDDFDWTLNFQPLTPSGGTGPNAPTTGVHYMFIEASGKQSGQYAMLSSPIMTDGTWCLSWKYSMYGINMGRLSVFVGTANTATADTEAWYREGDIGDRNWYQGSVNLQSPVPGENFKFAIVGTRANGYKGDMAIDDIFINKGNC